MCSKGGFAESPATGSAAGTGSGRALVALIFRRRGALVPVAPAGLHMPPAVVRFVVFVGFGRSAFGGIGGLHSGIGLTLGNGIGPAKVPPHEKEHQHSHAGEQLSTAAGPVRLRRRIDGLGGTLVHGVRLAWKRNNKERDEKRSPKRMVDAYFLSRQWNGARQRRTVGGRRGR